MYKKKTKQFSLKDQLYNKETVTQLASEISSVCNDFDQEICIQAALAGFKDRELKERMTYLAELMYEYIPGTYIQKLAIIIKSLPEPLDPAKQDNDFGSFIHAPHSIFVARYGLEKKFLKDSLNALREITKRFSAEYAIRFFINEHKQETLSFLAECARDDNYHVRRLASEGTRPKLPWAQKIHIDLEDGLMLLDVLYKDETRYVTRSVANHLNDIYKTNPELVYERLELWRTANEQDTEEMEWIVSHALRNALKQGDIRALRLLGYKKPDVIIRNFKAQEQTVSIGSTYKCSFEIKNVHQEDQKVLINYDVQYLKSQGSYGSKNFKIFNGVLKSGEIKTFEKKHPMRMMSTRALYPGTHHVVIYVNGEEQLKTSFELI